VGRSIWIKQPGFWVSDSTHTSKLKTSLLPPLVKKPSPSDTVLGELIDPREKVP
jgi:hypothetical protein